MLTSVGELRLKHESERVREREREREAFITIFLKTLPSFKYCICCPW